MYFSRVTLENLSKALFTRTMYKRGLFVEVYSFDHIPQSVLFGALAFAINKVLKKPLSVLDKIHLTSASPLCGKCGRYTFFHEPGRSVCEEHGYVVVSHVMVIHSVPLNPQVWQPRMINYEGEFTEHRRMSPRKFYALTPGQFFSFLVYVEDEEAKRVFLEALKVLCVSVNGAETAGFGIGWGRKMWGAFKAEVQKWREVRPVAKVRNVVSRIQSPFTSPGGKTYLAQNVKPLDVVVCNTVVRNVHHRVDRNMVSIYLEGSEVMSLEELECYPTDSSDWLLAFSSKVFCRRVGRKLVKAIEPSFLIHRRLVERTGVFSSDKA
ncbi:MAG: hypothetical protein DRP01_10310 [Archaeoglobales archaeon]|nr:MAG: hypothetical protein DRP01_10310 [Archaeoglobales archaeon]